MIFLDFLHLTILRFKLPACFKLFVPQNTQKSLKAFMTTLILAITLFQQWSQLCAHSMFKNFFSIGECTLPLSYKIACRIINLKCWATQK